MQNLQFRLLLACESIKTLWGIPISFEEDFDTESESKRAK